MAYTDRVFYEVTITAVDREAFLENVERVHGAICEIGDHHPGCAPRLLEEVERIRGRIFGGAVSCPVCRGGGLVTPPPQVD